jgi:hypothetical protein
LQATVGGITPTLSLYTYAYAFRCPVAWRHTDA